MNGDVFVLLYVWFRPSEMMVPLPESPGVGFTFDWNAIEPFKVGR
jgi:L-alanine-DL-glutamate epimerase-like enolase superfamily enzyme